MNPFDYLVTICGGFILGVIVFALLSGSGKPQIVVNMPADAQPLATLSTDAKVIGSDRAVLWYTIFDASIKAGATTAGAVDRANAAVDKVYGSTPQAATK